MTDNISSFAIRNDPTSNKNIEKIKHKQNPLFLKCLASQTFFYIRHETDSKSLGLQQNLHTIQEMSLMGQLHGTIC